MPKPQIYTDTRYEVRFSEDVEQRIIERAQRQQMTKTQTIRELVNKGLAQPQTIEAQFETGAVVFTRTPRGWVYDVTMKNEDDFALSLPRPLGDAMATLIDDLSEVS